MTQKKTIPTKAPKRVERVESSSVKKHTQLLSNEEEESDRRNTKDRRTKRTQRVERIERSSLKKRARSLSDEEEKKVTKERRSNKNKLADTIRKTAPQKRKAVAQR